MTSRVSSDFTPFRLADDCPVLPFYCNSHFDLSVMLRMCWCSRLSQLVPGYANPLSLFFVGHVFWSTISCLPMDITNSKTDLKNTLTKLLNQVYKPV